MEDEINIVEEPGEAHTAERRRRDRGASLIEYALLLALIAVVCVSAMSMLGGNNKAGLTHSQSCITAAMSGANPGC